MKSSLKTLMSKIFDRQQKADVRISSLDEHLREDVAIARELAKRSFL